jgi:hypothetical protein
MTFEKKCESSNTLPRNWTAITKTLSEQNWTAITKTFEWTKTAQTFPVGRRNSETRRGRKRSAQNIHTQDVTSASASIGIRWEKRWETLCCDTSHHEHTALARLVLTVMRKLGRLIRSYFYLEKQLRNLMYSKLISMLQSSCLLLSKFKSMLQLSYLMLSKIKSMLQLSYLMHKKYSNNATKFSLMHTKLI